MESCARCTRRVRKPRSCDYDGCGVKFCDQCKCNEAYCYAHQFPEVRAEGVDYTGEFGKFGFRFDLYNVRMSARFYNSIIGN